MSYFLNEVFLNFQIDQVHSVSICNENNIILLEGSINYIFNFYLCPPLISSNFLTHSNDHYNNMNNENLLTRDIGFDFGKGESLNLIFSKNDDKRYPNSIKTNDKFKKDDKKSKSEKEKLTVKKVMIQFLKYIKESTVNQEEYKGKEVRQKKYKIWKSEKKKFDKYLLYLSEGILLNILDETMLNQSFARIGRIIKLHKMKTNCGWRLLQHSEIFEKIEFLLKKRNSQNINNRRIQCNVI